MTDETQGADTSAADDALLSLTDKPADDQQAPEPKDQTPDPAAPPAPDAEAPAAKPKKTAQERIDELTWKAREAERQRDELLDRLGRQQPQQPAQPEGDGRPNPEQYEYGVSDERYVEDLAGWKAQQIATQSFAQFERQSRVRSMVQTFDQRVAQAFPEGTPEGIQAMRNLPEIPPAITDVILTSENGPLLADHLGTNTSELRRLSALPPHLQAYELAKIEGRLAAPPSPQPKTVSNAPAPAPQVRAANGKFQVNLETCSFEDFEKATAGMLRST
jgi:hypothetical protein